MSYEQNDTTYVLSLLMSTTIGLAHPLLVTVHHCPVHTPLSWTGDLSMPWPFPCHLQYTSSQNVPFILACCMDDCPEHASRMTILTCAKNKQKNHTHVWSERCRLRKSSGGWFDVAENYSSIIWRVWRETAPSGQWPLAVAHPTERLHLSLHMEPGRDAARYNSTCWSDYCRHRSKNIQVRSSTV